MMQPIIAIYENGVFRPLDPVELPEGARVEVSPVGQNGAQSTGEVQRPTAAKPLTGEALAALLDEFEALPLEGEPDPTLSTRYREILYPKQGEMP
jgi:predicted DNA-binding antitoxin AbrB/MazE fold protein